MTEQLDPDALMITTTGVRGGMNTMLYLRAFNLRLRYKSVQRIATILGISRSKAKTCIDRGAAIHRSLEMNPDRWRV